MAEIPNSPLVTGPDPVPREVGVYEIRRARMEVEVIYSVRPGSFVDVQAFVTDAIKEADDGHFGVASFVGVDLVEHVSLDHVRPLGESTTTKENTRCPRLKP